MKREYSKPTIHVEVLALDTPVANGCAASFGLEFPELFEQGWFVGEEGCGLSYTDAESDMGKYGDTLCYHSHARTVFQS